MDIGDRDASSPPGRTRRRGRPLGVGELIAVALLVTAAVVVAGFASGWKEYTWGARIGTFGSGLIVFGLGVAWQHRRERTSPSVQGPGAGPETGGGSFDRRGVAIWVGILVVAAAWDVCGLLTPPDKNHLTLSALELAYRPLHSLMFVYWLFAGWVLASTPLRRRRS